MSDVTKSGMTRRELLKNSGRFAAATAAAGLVLPRAYAAEENTIQIALVGCGGRGTGAAADALQTTSGPTKLVAMADVFEHKLDTSHRSLTARFGERVPGDVAGLEKGGQRLFGLQAHRGLGELQVDDDAGEPLRERVVDLAGEAVALLEDRVVPPLPVHPLQLQGEGRLGCQRPR